MLDAKAYLSRYGALGCEIEQKLSQIETLRKLEHSVWAGGWESSGAHSPRLLAAKQDMAQSIDALIALRDEISASIDAVEDDTLRQLLAYRYISKLTWEQVADKMGYCFRNVYRLHNRALTYVRMGTK